MGERQEGREAGQLTAVVGERGEGGLLLGTAGAVAHPHLQLVPRGLLQVVQDVRLGERGPLRCGPHRGPEGPVLECEGGDGTAAVVPADEVQPHARGVDAGEEVLLLGELGLCGERGTGQCAGRGADGVGVSTQPPAALSTQGGARSERGPQATPNLSTVGRDLADQWAASHREGPGGEGDRGQRLILCP